MLYSVFLHAEHSPETQVYFTVMLPQLSAGTSSYAVKIRGDLTRRQGVRMKEESKRRIQAEDLSTFLIFLKTAL